MAAAGRRGGGRALSFAASTEPGEKRSKSEGRGLGLSLPFSGGGCLTGWLCHIEPPLNPLCSLGGGEDIRLPQGFRKLLREHQLCEMLMGPWGKGSRVRRSQEPRLRSTPPLLSTSYRAHSPCAGQGFLLKRAPPWDPTWQGPARRPWATGMMPFLNSWGWRERAHRAPAGREGLDLLRWWALLSLPRREGTPERELGLLRLLGVPGALYTLTSARPCSAPVRSGQRHLTECDTEAGRGMRGPLPKASVSLLTLPPAPTPCPDRQPPPQGVAGVWGG